MAKKHQQQSNGENNEVMMVIGVALLCIVVWWTFKAKFAGMILGAKLLEAYFISFFTRDLDDLRLWMGGIDRRLVTLKDLFTVSQMVGSYVRFVTVPLLAYLGYRLYKQSPTEKFKRKFNQHTLPLAEADLYPWMKISTKINFDEMDPEKGPWAYAKTERMFTREHKLRDEKGGLNKEKATRVFIKQIGPLWMGYGRMRPHVKALFALFASRLARDFGASDRLLKQLAESAANGKLDYTGVDSLAKKYMESKPLIKLIKWHAYERTLLMSMLFDSRGGDTGKDALPPNFFLWLKGVDRPLWYTLADVGRKTPHVESAGVFAHWITERTRRKKLEMPFVENAVKGLEIELGKLTENGDEDLDDEQDLIVVKRPPSLPPPPPPPPPPPTRGAPRSSGREARGAPRGESPLDGMMVMGMGSGGVAVGSLDDFLDGAERNGGAGRGGMRGGGRSGEVVGDARGARGQAGQQRGSEGGRRSSFEASDRDE